jgi:hypothetical protein
MHLIPPPVTRKKGRQRRSALPMGACVSHQDGAVIAAGDDVAKARTRLDTTTTTTTGQCGASAMARNHGEKHRRRVNSFLRNNLVFQMSSTDIAAGNDDAAGVEHDRYKVVRQL